MFYSQIRKVLLLLIAIVLVPSLALAAPKKPKAIICISVDHGDSYPGGIVEPGCLGYYRPPKKFQKEKSVMFREAVVAYDIAVRLRDLLAALPIKIVMVVHAKNGRDDQPRSFGPRSCPADQVLLLRGDRRIVGRGDNESLDARSAIGNAAYREAQKLHIPCLWLSIHVNSVGNKSHRGTFIIVPGHARKGMRPIEAAFYRVFGRAHMLRRIKTRKGRWLLLWRDFVLEKNRQSRILYENLNHIPNKVIVETAHFTNVGDSLRVRTPQGRQQMAGLLKRTIVVTIHMMAPKASLLEKPRILASRGTPQPKPRVKKPAKKPVSKSGKTKPKKYKPVKRALLAARCQVGRAAFRVPKPLPEACWSIMFTRYRPAQRRRLKRLIVRLAEPIIFGRDPAAVDAWLALVKRHNQAIHVAAGLNNLPHIVICAVSMIEAGGKDNAVSKSNARGVMQLKKDTAILMGGQVWKGHDDRAIPARNYLLGGRFLAYLVGHYHGRLDLAVAAYHAGPGNLDWLCAQTLSHRLGRKVHWQELDVLIDRHDIKLLDLLEDPKTTAQYKRFKDSSMNYALKVACCDAAYRMRQQGQLALQRKQRQIRLLRHHQRRHVRHKKDKRMRRRQPAHLRRPAVPQLGFVF